MVGDEALDANYARTDIFLRIINVRTYKILEALQMEIPNTLERTWTQEPVMLEDALGRRTPIHLEFINSREVSLQSSIMYAYTLLNKIGRHSTAL